MEPTNTSRLGDWVVYNLDHLGLRGLTASLLLSLAIYLGWKFKSWRPFNLSVISLIALNVVVGLAKLSLEELNHD